MPETSNRMQQPALGRPRSESARRAILNAVDDMLVEQGYAALTMKGIAERAGVGRQTVYRWWSTKAEILNEACAQDAATELAVPLTANSVAVVSNYLAAVVHFLTRSVAGAAYRALLGEAQHDNAVAALLRGNDVLVRSAMPVVAHVLDSDDPAPAVDEELTAELLGPIVFPILTGAAAPTKAQLRERASRFVDRYRS
ncbi:TetR/AcrR family transcriptional regulator [Arthrobacter sp. SLBN-53]|uniref:TetR/AcrR family transcriptional regulator n=1 Tax=Arthrobacter sp. SLBN-53 TaxID=2768412 RepID=UPI0011515BDE|nr:TetR/AcrR family transcriptional regulator [Arthrobacter sp. SLBN-53]TQK27156.1 TetR family transcriptional regulator [Arthrobacter sp. SLBN-53]